VGIVDVQQIGDFVLHEEPLGIDLVQVDDEDFLEGGGALAVVAFDYEKTRSGDRGKVARVTWL
jgi:hypothetical protein